MKIETIKLIHRQGILPVFCPKNEAEAEIFTKAILSTPIHVVEITLRNELALKTIEQLKEKASSLIVGAGTILSGKLLTAAVNAGADFLVSPGYSEVLLKKAEVCGVPFLPGVATPSEIQNAYINGYTTLKYFPAQASGGTDSLKLYEGTFSDVSFIPTGGITLQNLSSYLALKNVIACGGSFMLPKEMLSQGDVEGIRQTILKCLVVRGGTK